MARPISTIYGYFNPRPHAGGDRKRRKMKLAQYYFNPRPHAGGDTLARM